MDRTERLDDHEEALRLALDAQQAGLWTALPGIVVSANLAAQTVVVQPSIQGSVTAPDGTVTFVNLPLLVDVPICWPRAGGFALTLPVAAGDEVLVVFASRCLDSWWQQGHVQPPVEPRMHDLSDGFALFAPTSQPRVLANVQTDGIELRDTARDTFIKLSAGGITIQGNITLNGNLTQTGDLTVTGPVDITGAVEIIGEETVTGGVLIAGSFAQAGGPMTSDGVNISGTHVHGGVTAGSGNSGPPH